MALLIVPEPSLVALVGAAGSGKSTFARAHFKPTEVLSSDVARAQVSDDENDLAATDDAFAVLHLIASRRLSRGKLTVVDATNLQAEHRATLVKLARHHRVAPVAIVLDLPVTLCEVRSMARRGRSVETDVIRQQARQLQRSLPGLEEEGFSHVYPLRTEDDVASVKIERRPVLSL